MSATLEELFSGSAYGDVPASGLQRAICRADGGLEIGDALTDDAIELHFGCPRSQIGLVPPVLVVLVCGVRSGKSFLAACGAIHDVLSADCHKLKAHEVPRHAIVAPTVDNAAATFRVLVGIVQASPILRRLVVGEPSADTLTLRRADGRVFEIVVVAAHRGGVTLRSRWLAGTTFEEVALFGIESTGAVVNAEELLRAAEARLLPGTKIRIVSSPMGRQGLLFDLFREHFGRPGRVLVVHAPTTAMNPSFPQAAVEALRARDPDAAARELEAKWIDAETAFVGGGQIEACVRSSPLIRPPVPGAVYCASMDCGTRGNAWTIAFARAIAVGHDGAYRVEISLAREWIGSKESPLSPAAVLGAIATLARPYRVRKIDCDRHSFDALQDHARPLGLALVETGPSERDEGYVSLQAGIASGLVELPPIAHVLDDLKALRKILTPTGFRIALPTTPDGRHCDFAPAIAGAIRAVGERGRLPGSKMLAALNVARARERGEYVAPPAPRDDGFAAANRAALGLGISVADDPSWPTLRRSLPAYPSSVPDAPTYRFVSDPPTKK